MSYSLQALPDRNTRTTTEWPTLRFFVVEPMWPVPCNMAALLGGCIPEQSPRPDEEDEIEVEVHLLSGRNSLIRIGM